MGGAGPAAGSAETVGPIRALRGRTHGWSVRLRAELHAPPAPVDAQDDKMAGSRMEIHVEAGACQDDAVLGRGSWRSPVPGRAPGPRRPPRGSPAAAARVGGRRPFPGRGNGRSRSRRAKRRRSRPQQGAGGPWPPVRTHPRGGRSRPPRPAPRAAPGHSPRRGSGTPARCNPRYRRHRAGSPGLRSPSPCPNPPPTTCLVETAILSKKVAMKPWAACVCPCPVIIARCLEGLRPTAHRRRESIVHS
jgi:hypothetical protein